jgi:hypothetical protein
MASVTVRDVVGEGPKHPNADHVRQCADQIRENAVLKENFFVNFEGLATQLEEQSRQGKGLATQALRETAAVQAANIRRFVAAVRKNLGG